MKTNLFNTYENIANTLETTEKELRYVINDIVKTIQNENGKDYIEFNDDTSYPYFEDYTIGGDTIIAVRYNETKNKLEFIAESQMQSAEDATDEDWFDPDMYGAFNNAELVRCLKDIASFNIV